MIMNKQILASTFFAAVFFSAAAHAAWEAGAGVEAYSWQEYATSANGVAEKPTEFGPRFALHLNWTQSGEQGLLFAYNAKFYTGKVHYDTYEQKTDTPVSTSTRYLGTAQEARMLYRKNSDSYVLDYVGGLGWDIWRRTIAQSQIEDYSILYLRGGFNLDRPSHGTGWHGGGGLKFPFQTYENAHLTDQGYYSNPIITPGKDISLYAELGYRIDSHLDVVGYYDSWRFSKSDIRTTSDVKGTWQVWQPRSSMNLLGIRLMQSY